MFYLFDQNNSYGRFDVNDKLCHKLYIEADSESEAISKAEELGCYWDGVDKGIDCPCCGDRWYRRPDKVSLEKYSTDGYPVSEYVFKDEKDAIRVFNRKYGKYEFVKQPKLEQSTSFLSNSKKYCGRIKIKDIEEYAKFMANEHGWTSPDARIFYKDGTVKEIYGER